MSFNNVLVCGTFLVKIQYAASDLGYSNNWLIKLHKIVGTDFLLLQ